MEKQNKWKSDIIFVFAAVGAAVGLGNLWRFPYVAFENGGAAFFIPYLFCVVLIGLPLVFLEIGVGLWGGGSIAKGFKKVSPKWTWIGWWVLVNSMVIVFYYAVVLAWALQFVFYSLKEQWGNDTISFFTSDVLGLTDSPFILGDFRILTIIALLVIWIAIFFIIKSGTKGLSKVLLITVPLPLLIIIILSIKGITVPGGKDGLKFFLEPETSKLLNVSVWGAAASQVILSLGMGMGQLVAYASKKKNEKNVIKSAFSIVSLDFLFSFLAGITVFTTLGFLAFNKGVEIADLKIDGLFLAFATYPAAISTLPLAPLWGVLFFTLLVLLGIDSAFAVIEATLTGYKEMSKKKRSNILVFTLCSIGLFGGLVFTLGGGLYWLDIVDNWVAQYSILSIIILQCIVFGNYSINKISQKINIKKPEINKIWKYWVTFIIPVILAIFVFFEIKGEIEEPYGGYPNSALLIGGWGVFFLAIIVGVFIAKRYNKKSS